MVPRKMFIVQHERDEIMDFIIDFSSSQVSVLVEIFCSIGHVFTSLETPEFMILQLDTNAAMNS